MVMKGSVQPNHAPKNNFELIVVGLPPILFTEVGGIENEIEFVDMPDRTQASGGNTKGSEFPVKLFEHHTVERAAMDLWFAEGKDPVNPTYKKVGTLIKRGIDGSVVSTQTLIGLCIKKRKTDDLDLANEGEPAMVEYTMWADDALPV